MAVANLVAETGNLYGPLWLRHKGHHWQDLDGNDRVPLLKQDIAVLQAAQLRFRR